MERIYNIFLIYQNDVCSQVAYKDHEHSGNDQEKIDFLRNRVERDFESAKPFSLNTPFTRAEHIAKSRLGEGHHLFDALFESLGADSSPLFISTPVQDGKVFVNYKTGHGPLDVTDVAAKLGEKGTMDDWLVKYTSDKGIDLPQLIHDDYFLAVKLTFNAKLYVSAMKLLLSCVDSISYIEYGNEQGSFVKWLDAYATLAPLGVTAAELWELRNGILHMTNVSSKRVRANKVRRISFRIGGAPAETNDSGSVYYFDFLSLINVFAEALKCWIETYNVDRDKFTKFIERYDETISDSRVAFAKSGLEQR